MITIYKEDNKEVRVNTKQYEIGLYVFATYNNRDYKQFGVDMKEEDYHKELRKLLSEKGIEYSGTEIE